MRMHLAQAPPAARGNAAESPGTELDYPEQSVFGIGLFPRHEPALA